MGAPTYASPSAAGGSSSSGGRRSSFGAIARVRGWAYARRILPSYDVGTPVVCVGNLAAGGTGKTPMIAWLARTLGARDDAWAS